jgi:predicted nucleotidyltransferase
MLQKCSLWITGTVFFDDPNQLFELMAISKMISLAHTSVKKHLNTLIDLHIVQKKEVSFGNKTRFLYTANKRSPLFKHYKMIYNMDRIKTSGLIECLADTFQPNSIVLFGSFSKGEDTKDSDVDLFVESNKENIELSKFEEYIGRKIEIHFKDNFREYQNELKNNIINGITLHGYLEGYDA